jgi:hypothetical protein
MSTSVLLSTPVFVGPWCCFRAGTGLSIEERDEPVWKWSVLLDGYMCRAQPEF